MSAGKGDRPRPVDGGKYRENFDMIDWKAIKVKRDGKLYSWPNDAKWLAVEPYVFDGPEPKKIPAREFMKTNTEGDE